MLRFLLACPETFAGKRSGSPKSPRGFWEGCKIPVLIRSTESDVRQAIVILPIEHQDAPDSMSVTVRGLGRKPPMRRFVSFEYQKGTCFSCVEKASVTVARLKQLLLLEENSCVTGVSSGPVPPGPATRGHGFPSTIRLTA